ncbi:hypothetical protein OSTOST_09256, partial [Ostertagia ostertagi]
MPTLSPAYMSPPTPCLQNCTFITVQDEDWSPSCAGVEFLVSGLAGVLAAFASNFYLMLFCRFIQGSFFNVSYCLITPIAIQFESWRAVQFTTSFPTLLFGVVMLLSSSWIEVAALLPESFGFLITKRRATEAKKWIQRANRWGGSNFDCDVLKTIENETARVPEEKNLTESL